MNKEKVYIVISINKNQYTAGRPSYLSTTVEALEIYKNENAAIGRAKAIAHYDQLINHHSINDHKNYGDPLTDVKIFADTQQKFVAVCTSHQVRDIIAPVVGLINKSTDITNEVLALQKQEDKIKNNITNNQVFKSLNDLSDQSKHDSRMELPIGWDLNNKPILGKNIINDPWNVKLTCELSKQQRKALVISRIKKQNNYFIDLGCGITFYQNGALSELLNNYNSYNGNPIIECECELIDDFIYSHRNNDEESDSEESSEDEYWDD